MNEHLTRYVVLMLSALTVMVSSPLAAVAEPSTPAAEAASPVERLDDATTQAVELEEHIAELEAQEIAIESRMGVLDERIAAQRRELERARGSLKAARDLFGMRVVSMYKTGSVEPLELLLGARSVEDFLARGTLLGHIVTQDREIWSEAAVTAAEAEYQATVLDDLKAQENELESVNDSRQQELDSALVRQETLIGELTEEALEYLARVRASRAQSRDEWRRSSVPLEARIERVEALVEPYDGLVFLVSEGQPTRYTVAGDSFPAVCSWYGNEFHGRNTASGQVFNENDFTCASRDLPFGTRLALTRGDRRIVVVVNDRGPFVAGRDLDLSKAAAAALGFSGVEEVQAQIVIATE
jgi:peptidoglycan hydrolase CwlO-like protein